MNLPPIVRPRDDLHGLLMNPVASDNLKVGVTGHHKAMPVEKLGVIQRLIKGFK